ncbi:MarR family transcriptional regulator [Methanoculleus horonobensis]|uniref:MarR family transcriptional regulator n=1 Tax=Methanoculleus horonobensis TaxID=528314 RepID=UPI000AC05566|nr:MarR family transcriptional regulator [Methanoculleus horonobensis]NLE26529.1 MarR family transcriptional regulator [Clostridiaceae bacterium]
MVSSLPRNLLEKFARLYAERGTSEFRFQEAEEILGETEKYVGQILPNLVRAGWLEKKVDPEDSRRKIYRVVDPNRILQRLGQELKDGPR